MTSNDDKETVKTSNLKSILSKAQVEAARNDDEKKVMFGQGNRGGKLHRSKETRKVHKKKCKTLLRRFPLVGISTTRAQCQPYAVIDPGAELDLIGGNGWKILHKSNVT